VDFSASARLHLCDRIEEVGQLVGAIWVENAEFSQDNRKGIYKRAHQVHFVAIHSLDICRVVRQLAFAAKLDAGGHGTLAPFAGALADQIALEVRDRGQECRERPSLRARRIPQRIAERLKRRASLADPFDQVEQFTRRAAQAVKLGRSLLRRRCEVEVDRESGQLFVLWYS
jgi:hypothetical protein